MEQLKQLFGHQDSSSDLSQIREQFEALQQIPVQSREVTLLIKADCGCGDFEMEIVRSVPFDSPLQDGDRVEGPPSHNKQAADKGWRIKNLEFRVRYHPRRPPAGVF